MSCSRAGPGSASNRSCSRPSAWPGLSEPLARLPADVPVFCASKPVMSAITGFPIHRGVLAVGLRGAETEPDLVPPPPGRPSWSASSA